MCPSHPGTLWKRRWKTKCLCCRFLWNQSHTNNLPECFRPSYIFINVTDWKYKSLRTKSSPLFFHSKCLSGWIIKRIQLLGAGTILAWRHIFLRQALVLWRLLLKLHYVVSKRGEIPITVKFREPKSRPNHRQKPSFLSLSLCARDSIKGGTNLVWVPHCRPPSKSRSLPLEILAPFSELADSRIPVSVASHEPLRLLPAILLHPATR